MNKKCRDLPDPNRIHRIPIDWNPEITAGVLLTDTGTL